MAASNFFLIDTPLEVLPSATQIRAANLYGFCAYVRELGGNPQRLLDRHALDHAAIHRPDAAIDLKAYVSLFEDCAQTLGDPLFGLHLARRQAPDVFGCVTALCRAAPDLRTALCCVIDYFPVVHSSTARFELCETDDLADFRYGADRDFGVSDQTTLQGLHLIVQLFSEITAGAFRLSYLTLAADVSPAHLASLEQIMGCRIARAATNALTFPRELLAKPVAYANATLFNIVRTYLERVKRSRRATPVERVEDYISATLGTGTCSIARCARHLGLSERTLQLQLQTNGLRFCDMLERRRRNLSEDYLARADLSLDDVACLLGYSEQSSFARAYKRWTMTTPQQRRARRPIDRHAAAPPIIG